MTATAPYTWVCEKWLALRPPEAWTGFRAGWATQRRTLLSSVTESLGSGDGQDNLPPPDDTSDELETRDCARFFCARRLALDCNPSVSGEA